MAAGIATEFDHPHSLLTITNCLFFNNTADMGAGINTNHLSGTIVARSNYFIGNNAITGARVFIGSGAAIIMSGSANTYVTSENNLFLFNVIEFKGN